MKGKGSVVLLSFIVSLIASGCSDSCMDCTIEHYDDLSVIAIVQDICGDDSELDQEEANLAVEYRCVQCKVFLSTGVHDTGILCGTKEYTDSVEQSNAQGAIEIDESYSCEFFSDTLIIICHPAED